MGGRRVVTILFLGLAASCAGDEIEGAAGVGSKISVVVASGTGEASGGEDAKVLRGVAMLGAGAESLMLMLPTAEGASVGESSVRSTTLGRADAAAVEVVAIEGAAAATE